MPSHSLRFITPTSDAVFGSLTQWTNRANMWDDMAGTFGSGSVTGGGGDLGNKFFVPVQGAGEFFLGVRVDWEIISSADGGDSATPAMTIDYPVNRLGDTFPDYLGIGSFAVPGGGSGARRTDHFVVGPVVAGASGLPARQRGDVASMHVGVFIQRNSSDPLIELTGRVFEVDLFVAPVYGSEGG